VPCPTDWCLLVAQGGPPQSDLLVVACGEIVRQLIQAHEQGRNVNLNGGHAAVLLFRRVYVYVYVCV
jgi:hypothetical protein